MGDLAKELPHGASWPVADARTLFLQLMLAIDYCHSKDIANRDINIKNVLLPSYTYPDGTAVR
jgi:serine/threonine protein kinase